MRSRPSRPRSARWIGGTALATVLLTSACTGTPGARADDSGVALVIGGSLTAGSGAPDEGLAAADARGCPRRSGTRWSSVAGERSPGATTADMRSGVRQADGDVLVVTAGTDDALQGADRESSRDDVLAIARTLRIDTVVVSAIPPSGLRPEAAAAYDERLRRMAAEQGWTFVDPWQTARQGEEWVPGDSADGTHPTQEVAARVGAALRSAVLARAAGDRGTARGH